MRDLEAGVAHAVFAAHGFQVFLPALAIGRVGQHEVELLGRKGIVRQGGPLGTTDDVVGVFALAFEQHVGFANGVGFGVDFLPVEVAFDLQAALGGNGVQRFFGHSEHAAGAAGVIKQQVAAGFEL